MPRIFIAIPVSPAVQAALAALPREGAPSFRWVARGQYHITLKFLGEIPEAQIETVLGAVQTAVSEGPFGPLHLVAEGIGAFPTLRRPRTVWAGVAGDVQKLGDLQAAIDTQLVARDFPADDRPFKPHITIARIRGSGSIPNALQSFLQHTFGSWQVSDVHIIESRLSPSGPHYTLRHATSLA